MGRHNRKCKREYQKKRRQAKKDEKKKKSEKTYKCDSLSQTTVESSESEAKSVDSPFDCSSSCCLSTDSKIKDSTSSDSSGTSKFVKKLKSLKKADKRKVANEIHRDPLYVRWQEYKLLNKRIRDIENTSSS